MRSINVINKVTKKVGRILVARSKKVTPVKEEKDLNVGGTNIDMSELAKAGFVMLEDSTYGNVDNIIPTGLPALDITMGGGIPLSRVTQVYGKNASGKSMVAIQILKMALSMGVAVVYLDSEGTFSKDNLRNMGIDPNKILVPEVSKTNPEGLTIEAMGESIEATLGIFDKYDKPVLFVLDSIGASLSKKELSLDLESEQPGIQAKAITKMIKKVAPQITLSGGGLLILNQIRESIGGGPFSSVSIPGGRALEHALSLNMQIARRKTIKRGEDSVGHVAKFSNKKSKVSDPFQVAEQFLFNAQGFNEIVNIIFTGEELKLVKVRTAGSKGKVVEVPNAQTGEVEALPYWDFLEEISTQEGAEEYMYFLKPVFQKIIKHYFPADYPPLRNTNVDIRKNPLYEGLDELYKEAYTSEKPDTEEEDTKE